MAIPRPTTLVAIVWALPWTYLGIALGLAGLLTGGGGQRAGKVLEFYGGWLDWLLLQAPIEGGASALTLGHAVLARTAGDLDRARAHELIHVAQYERWGPLLVPAYLVCCGWLWMRGRDPYWENPFEQEAYATEAAGDQPGAL